MFYSQLSGRAVLLSLSCATSSHSFTCQIYGYIYLKLSIIWPSLEMRLRECSVLMTEGYARYFIALLLLF